jgi:hypothetical protein
MRSPLPKTLSLALAALSPLSAAALEPTIQQAIDEARAAGAQIDAVIETPSSQGPHGAKFQLDDSVRVYPDHSVYLVIPSHLRSRGIDFVGLAHRQSRRDDRSGVRSIKDRDHTPALTSVQVYDPSFAPGERWRYWCGHSSGEQGAKFAEVRSHRSPEEEMLYEWTYNGHVSIDQRCPRRNKSRRPLLPSLVRLVSVGKDPVRLESFSLQMTTTPPTDADDWVFTPGTRIGDLATGDGRRFGGGQKHGGEYPSAIRLREGSRPRRSADLPQGVRFEGSAVRVALRPGASLARIEVAAGDARGTDGRKYRPGNGHLRIVWIRAGGLAPMELLGSTNIGPEGVYRGLFETDRSIAAPGDEIEIQAVSGTVNVMAVRVGYY